MSKGVNSWKWRVMTFRMSSDTSTPFARWRSYRLVEFGDFCGALDFDVELEVLSEAKPSEAAGFDQGPGSR
jgi:hypothetical protein